MGDSYDARNTAGRCLQRILQADRSIKEAWDALHEVTKGNVLHDLGHIIDAGMGEQYDPDSNEKETK